MTVESSRKGLLRPGDLVEVRSATEILASLDGDGCLDAVPFMPEMLQFVGRRFIVSRRVEKICDTIARTGSRRMHGTVYLEDLRCDGSGHDGCQAGCRIYWKERWLRRVETQDPEPDPGSDAVGELEKLARIATRTIREDDGNDVEAWRCQATEALKASEPLKVSDLRQYWRELTSGNVPFLRFVQVLARGFVMEVASRTRLIGAAPLLGKEHGGSIGQELGLKLGDRVKVRSKSEIAQTLDAGGYTRGLSFDREMLPQCGKTLRVKDRVERIIDDRTGRMLNIKSDCLILDGVVCSGERSIGRWFCPREIYPYWREAWVERADDAPSGADDDGELGDADSGSRTE